MSERIVNVLEGSTFVVGNRDGNLLSGDGPPHGFFSHDTRFISTWELKVDQVPLALLGLDQEAHFYTQFFLTPDVGPNEQAPYSVMRRRLVDEVWIEEFSIISHCHIATEVAVELLIDTDFADLFEVKDGVSSGRGIKRQADSEGGLKLSYIEGEFRRSVAIRSSPPAQASEGSFRYNVALAPGEQWTCVFTFTPHSRQSGFDNNPIKFRGAQAKLLESKKRELGQWLDAAPKLEAEDPNLARTYRASLSDLAALRMHPELHGADTLPAAGLPWFMALFGRDSLITSFQALPYVPSLASTTLRVLASHQATLRDDFQEREPGKILHELRFGELTVRGHRPHSPYFGSADSTLLFLILLDEYHRWTGDDALLLELEPNARAALRWIDESGDADGDGYVEYACRNHATGLQNQCWKDSWDSMQFRNGAMARGPIATCEIQGYVYDARIRSARLARTIWNDETLAIELERKASNLRESFRRDFWIEERGCHALALDGDKLQVDGLTSNIGHLLWSGILDQSEAEETARKLLGDELFSGWGVRTLGAQEAGYNPLGYHTGTVWPHENSLIVAGLGRYGLLEEAGRVGAALLNAAPHFEHRLPEVFAGYPASTTEVPVAFPTASRPQAWSAAAPLLILTTLAGLEPGESEESGSLPNGFGKFRLVKQP